MRRGRLKDFMISYRFLILFLSCFAIAEVLAYLKVLDELKSMRSLVKNISVIILYLSVGFHTKKEALMLSKYFRIFMTTHLFNFFIVPILIHLLMFVIGYVGEIDKWIKTGFIALGCFSPPLSSAVILTKISNGNELASVINASVGCLIGAVLTPILLLLHVGVSCILPVRTTVIGVLLFGALPILLGYVLQHSKILSKIIWRSQTLANIATFALIFTSFYETFLENEFTFSAHEVLITLFTILFLQALLMYLSVQFALKTSSKKSDLKSEDLVAIMFGSVHKSLTIGLPLLKTLYGGYSHLSQISLPLLMYYPVQFILGALLSPVCKGWISNSLITKT